MGAWGLERENGAGRKFGRAAGAGLREARGGTEHVITSSVVIRNVSHEFGSGNRVLENIELELAAGSFVALVGPSGCGKSTLLRFIAGLDRPTRGSIELSATVTAKHGSRLAFVFQDAQLLPWRSVLDNVALPLELAGTSRSEARERARAPLEAVELADVHERYPDELSGGMRMRVSIARALVTDPEILLLDEPFAALDELTRQRLDERLRALWLARKMTVIFVTHALAEAAFLADRALVMSKRPGKIVLDHALALPVERTGELRTTREFAEQTAILYRALAAHGGLDEAHVEARA